VIAQPVAQRLRNVAQWRAYGSGLVPGGQMGKALTPRMAERIELWPVERLVPFEGNARTHSAAQLAQLAASIQRFGFLAPILVDGESGILAGHGRLMAARELGMQQVPVVVLDHLTPDERRAYVVVDNKIAENAGWDEERLAAELGALMEAEFDLGALGFSDDDLRRLTDGLELGAFEQLSQPLAPVTERAEPEDQGQGGLGLDREQDEDGDATRESGEVEERHVFSVSMRWDDREQVLMAVAAAKGKHGLEGTAEALAQVCREWLDDRAG
jgi:ParB-like chromosome segregation protein Spo0J